MEIFILILTLTTIKWSIAAEFDRLQKESYHVDLPDGSRTLYFQGIYKNSTVTIYDETKNTNIYNMKAVAKWQQLQLRIEGKDRNDRDMVYVTLNNEAKKSFRMDSSMNVSVHSYAVVWSMQKPLAFNYTRCEPLDHKDVITTEDTDDILLNKNFLCMLAAIAFLVLLGILNLVCLVARLSTKTSQTRVRQRKISVCNTIPKSYYTTNDYVLSNTLHKPDIREMPFITSALQENEQIYEERYANCAKVSGDVVAERIFKAVNS